jgi:hypothetical protein
MLSNILDYKNHFCIMRSRCSERDEYNGLCLLGSDRLCDLVVRVLGYRSGGPGSIPGTTRKKKVVGLELDRKVAAPV